MNYIIKIDKRFIKLDTTLNDTQLNLSQNITKLESNITDTLTGNNKLQEFIYPTLTTYTDKDRLKAISEFVDIKCEHIDKFGKNVELNDDNVIAIINNINNLTVINTLCNLQHIYKEVYLCNLYYDNPVYNIHYIVCKNKIDKNNKTLEIITSNACLNNNLDNIYNYLYSYYSSILILIKIYNIEQDPYNIYKLYCKNFNNII